MANRTSRHLDFLVDHLQIIFVDFGYCMDPLFIMNLCIADDFHLEISPRCSVIDRDLLWKQSELY